MKLDNLSRRRVVGLLVAFFSSAALPANANSQPSLKVTAGDGSFDRIKAAGSLTFGTSNDQPFCFLDPTTNQIAGIDAEILLAILQKLDIPKHEVQQVDFDGLIPGLLASRMDVIADAMYVTPKRSEVVNFTNGWYQYGDALVVRKGNPGNLHSLKDLPAGASFGAQLGTVYADWLNEVGGIQVKVYPTVQNILDDIKIGRLDGALVDAPVASYLLQRDPSYAAAYEIVSDYQPKDIGIVAAGLRKEDLALLEVVNWALNEIKRESKDLEILQRWGLTERNRVAIG
ncbi:amino acid ABC transporter substrate-binding protein [Agrobacterium tumefaciens]|uniref:ABC transporter substrate-binding protein n=1 Tax=Agrobacterium tumefaciens TaxID=358 RepID=UPI001571BB7A|nr:ABC transporter substrate-binding protein [Agrobacterium tumefaciens]NTE68272.1 amino acid ABC transporter substrate-binding protein [Agrobacterium tumefaciens]